MPNDNRYKKNRAGYILEITEKLEETKTPAPSYLNRLSIGMLYELTQLIKVYGVEKAMKAYNYLISDE